MFANYSGFILRESASDREKKYSEFYSKVIRDYFDIEENFISKVKEILDSGNELSLPESVSNTKCYQCAYLLQFGVCDTCFVTEKFYESAMEYTKIIKTLSCKGLVNICCLGSQAFFAVLGLCKVIEESVQQFGFLDEVPTIVQIFVIEKDRTWKNLYEYIVAAANKEYTKLKLKLDFFVEDLIREFSEKTKMRINKAHIVIIVYYLSRLNSGKNFRITKNTLVNMKKNAVLFHLDDNFKDHQKHFKDVVKKNEHFSEIKSSREPEKYTLNKETKLAHEQLYDDMAPLNSFWNANIPPVMYSTWIKNPAIKLDSAVEVQPVSDTSPHKREYRAKSSNTIRNSTEKFRLVGKFATMDMEKKNKDDSHRHKAKDAAVSRYANFDDCYMDY